MRLIPSRAEGHARIKPVAATSTPTPTPTPTTADDAYADADADAGLLDFNPIDSSTWRSAKPRISGAGEDTWNCSVGGCPASALRSAVLAQAANASTDSRADPGNSPAAAPAMNAGGYGFITPPVPAEALPAPHPDATDYDRARALGQEPPPPTPLIQPSQRTSYEVNFLQSLGWTMPKDSPLVAGPQMPSEMYSPNSLTDLARRHLSGGSGRA